jgi:hypothetical protein
MTCVPQFKRKFPRDAGELPPEIITRCDFPAFWKICYLTKFVETFMWRLFEPFSWKKAEGRGQEAFMNALVLCP